MNLGPYEVYHIAEYKLIVIAEREDKKKFCLQLWQEYSFFKLCFYHFQFSCEYPRHGPKRTFSLSILKVKKWLWKMKTKYSQ